MILLKIRDSKLQAALAEGLRKTKDTLALMREIAGIMHDEVEENFAAQGRPGWAPLKPSTVKKRALRGKGPEPILQDSGRLANQNIPDATETRAVVANNTAYAAAQNLGAEITMYPRSSLFAQNRSKKGRFAKGRQKEMVGGKGKSTRGQYVVKIIARPFMQLGPGGLGKILTAVKRFFGQ